ncbi:hypothetical protein LZC95_07880 [Pendulispora brunnea]|uniref:Uncharacterized protein n=1 Tax=Pendulispora brunnea TaxID=2905690 RepID=A0ABZ2KFB9_9BACT
MAAERAIGRCSGAGRTEGRFGLCVGGYQRAGRVRFHTRWPQYQDGRSFHPRDDYSITCSSTRAPSAIAADLERRLLVWYDQVLPRAQEAIRTSNASAQEAMRAARRLAHAARANAPSSERRGNGDYIELRGRLPGVDRVRISPAYDENPLRVRLELDDLSAEAALDLLARVRALKVDVPLCGTGRRCPRR